MSLSQPSIDIPPQPSLLMGDTTLQLAANSLNSLPTEILLLIAESLNKISKASFSLCSRSVYQKLRCQFLKFSRLSYHERKQFLDLLLKDLDYGIYCHRCERLHVVRGDPGKNWCSLVDRSTSFYHLAFSHHRVQLALRLHHAGKDASEQLRILSRTWSPTPQYRRKVKTRIGFGSLLLKDEHSITIPRSSKVVVIIGYNLKLCSHLEGAQELSARVSAISSMIECNLSHSRNGKECSCNRIISCQTCRTDITVKVKNNLKDRVIIVTAWKDMGGEGSPYSNVWNAHFRLSGDNSSDTASVPKYLSHDSIRSAFRSLSPRAACPKLGKRQSESSSTADDRSKSVVLSKIFGAFQRFYYKALPGKDIKHRECQ